MLGRSGELVLLGLVKLEGRNKDS